LGHTVKSGPILSNSMIWFGTAGGEFYKISNANGTLQTGFPITSLSGDVDHGPWVDLTYSQILFGTTTGQVGAKDR
jgi:outer membrane protein assembly factor BamB